MTESELQATPSTFPMVMVLQEDPRPFSRGLRGSRVQMSGLLESERCRFQSQLCPLLTVLG